MKLRFANVSPARVFPARALLSLSFAVLLSAAFPDARADGDATAGQEKSSTCAACHGPEGIATQPSYPNLAGQYESYLAQALLSYRSGARENAIMYGFASQLSDEDIDDLAAWFASQAGPLTTAPRP